MTKTHLATSGSRTPEFVAWINMKQRCLNENASGAAFYAGVTVCQRWMDSFEDFLEDVGPRPSALYSIDRHPISNGNYEPGNVRWATAKQQACNRKSNALIEHAGEIKPLSQWAEEARIRWVTLAYRLKRGWSMELALAKPGYKEYEPRSRKTQKKSHKSSNFLNI